VTRSIVTPIRNHSAPQISAACLLCNNAEQIRPLFELTRPIVECRRCGLVYAAGAPSPYSDYSEAYYTEGMYSDYLGDRSAIHRNAGRKLSRLARLTAGRELLDIGCATGFFLEKARAEGWSVRGLEVSQYASEYARRNLGLEVQTGSIVSLPNGLPKVDVVTMWDTIEHLDRPDLALQNIRRLLRPDGVLVFSTGDYDSVLRRVTGKRWRLFADPTHNFFFTKDTLRRMLEQAGYQILSIDQKGKWVSLSLVLHQSPLPLKTQIRRWLTSSGLNPSVYVNLWDVVTVYARPVSTGI
jgi:2-polyprenyl-3-methyl-5-hydroxy-6-metoxy-1,4-benzoquinol methylase